eukprot:CAMPEP_0113626410 /NCGR_PEP_ID=MMETSP0017_2-20120614/13658_1 /TAXON_ID=2856 /ORGANISM="Cylindrotheca closterium" /LENGTH=930 /DNA_ID=CAMNT_0000536589 /DNA_START=162 /DNA_END=2954 /DNA_ORIENTATION=+ /assembly_acc=CAM_ASM_000147
MKSFRSLHLGCFFLLLCLSYLTPANAYISREAVTRQAQDDGFFGIEIEDCDTLACLNGGRCLSFDSNNDGVMDPQCLCPGNFTGTLCETPKPCDLPCENGSTCHNDVSWWLYGQKEMLSEYIFVCILEGLPGCNTDYCECPANGQFYGDFCELSCDLQCENGSTCEFRGPEQECQCSGNFYGDLCENECSIGCLNNGRCIASKDGTERCICYAGFEGDRCQTARPCDKQCTNGGVCTFEDIDDIDAFDDVFNGCNSTNCFSSGFTYCNCPEGQLGDLCEISCSSNCGENGECVFLGMDTNTGCLCKEGFSGDSCQFQCSLDCNNNGLCVADGVNEYCECQPLWEGATCETKKSCDLDCPNGSCVLQERRWFDQDAMQYCLLDSAYCREQEYQRCQCTSDWTGPDCSEPCPCENNGSCQSWWSGRRKLQTFETLPPKFPPIPEQPTDEEAPGYYCECPFGFTGEKCEQQMEPGDCGCQNGGICSTSYYNGDDFDIVYEDDGVSINNNNNNANSNASGPGGSGETTSSVGGSTTSTVGTTTSIGGTTTPIGGTSLPVREEYCICPDYNKFTGEFCEIEVDACMNACQNGGTCNPGPVSSVQGVGNRNLKEAQRQLQFSCTCPEGTSGTFCELKACGSGSCGFGSACIELPAGESTAAGDDFVCDCFVGSSKDEGLLSLGRQCSAPADYYDCSFSKDHNNEPWACSNGGRCYYGDSSGPSCYCQEPFTGPRCEYDSTNAADMAWSSCGLTCNNGGTCLKGPNKPIGDIFLPFLEATKKAGLFDYKSTDDFEYCYCPAGFFGVQCEEQYELCGDDGEHICFHGSKCEKSGDEWGCNCDGTLGAGRFCQYKATDTCGDEDVSTFCTNQGTCTLGADPVCSCVNGWEGAQCEIDPSAPAFVPNDGGGSWSGGATVGKSWSVALLALMGIAISWFIY